MVKRAMGLASRIDLSGTVKPNTAWPLCSARSDHTIGVMKNHTVRVSPMR